MQGTGLAGRKNEGEAMNQDSGSRQKYITSFTNQAIALSTIITREAIDDNQYQKDFPRLAENLKQSLRSTKDTIAGLFMANAFNNIGGDGVSYFNTAHPFTGGTFSNRLNLALNEASVEQAMILSKRFRSESGLKMPAQLRKLIVDPVNIFAAERVTKSVYAPDNANNAVNPVYTMGLIREGYKDNNYINITNSATPNWFILTDKPGLVLFQRTKAEFEVHADPIGTTKNMIFTAYERYSLNMFDPRCAIGSTGV